MEEILSRRLRGEFEDFLVTKTLKEIERYFDNYDIPPGTLPANKVPSGQRRALILSYYQSIDWSNPQQVSIIIKVFQDILLDLSKNDLMYNQDWNEKQLSNLNSFLNRDGYNFNGKKIERIGQVVDIIDLDEQTKSLLEIAHFNEYVQRINKSIDSDPSLAIGSTKELLESLMKTILTDSGSGYEKSDSKSY
jgi:hypothetical protein